MLKKVELRKQMIKKRSSLSKKEKKLKDQSIYKQVIKDKDYIAAKSVFLFLSFGSEINTKPIIENALHHNKKVFLPKVVGENLKLYEIEDFENLERSNYGILEPNEHCKSIGNHKIDFILMPGLAFDSSGGRVGYGGGYYDRYIFSITNYKEIPKVAIAYDFQIVDQVPVSDYDIPVDRIIVNEVKMFKGILDSFRNIDTKTFTRGLIIAFVVDIVYNLFGLDNNFIKYYLIILLIVITMPGMGIFKRK